MSDVDADGDATAFAIVIPIPIARTRARPCRMRVRRGGARASHDWRPGETNETCAAGWMEHRGSVAADNAARVRARTCPVLRWHPVVANVAR